MKNQKKTIITILCFSVVLCLMSILLAGWTMDSLQLDPWFGFRWWSSFMEKKITVDPSRYGADEIHWRIINDREAMVELTLSRNGTMLGAVGASLPAYIGFNDVDGDGKDEIIVVGWSRYGGNGVWRCNGHNIYEISNPSWKAKMLIGIGGMLLYSPLYIAIGVPVLILLVGIWLKIGGWHRQASRLGQSP